MLGLQRAAGNAAVAGLLGRRGRPGRERPPTAPPKPGAVVAPEGAISGGVLRALGDGHDLTSSRFAGDARLEACFDDEARLAEGATGESVVKVQQALIDLGSDLGPTGADGQYGPRTAAAVRAFKAEQRLGFETIGDVGPGTMGRLDELFGDGPRPDPVPPSPDDGTEPSLDEPPAPGEDVTPQACPAPDDVVTAVERAPEAVRSSPLLADAAAPVTGPGGSGGLVGVGTHLGITEAVRRFKGKMNAAGVAEGLNLTQRGQFFWSRQLSIAVSGELDRLERAGAPPGFVVKARQAFDAVMARDDATANRLLRQLDREAAGTRSPEKAAMNAVLHLAEGQIGPVMEGGLFSGLNASATDALPSLAPIRSLRALSTLRHWDKQSCGFHAFQVARRLRAKGGIADRTADKGAAFSAQLASGGAFRDRRPAGSGTQLVGDRIFQTGVGAAVDKLRKALDNGHVVHARVLSGVGYGEGCVRIDPRGRVVRLNDGPPEEHSLVIIGFDGNEFVFDDPDATVSRTPEPGFGKLFFDPSGGRLSTAENEADFLVDNCGEHTRGDKRYQIISLATF